MDKQATGLRSPKSPNAPVDVGESDGQAGSGQTVLGQSASGPGSSQSLNRGKTRRHAALALAIVTLFGALSLLSVRLAPTSGPAQALALIAPLPQVPAAQAQAALDEFPSDLPRARAQTLKELSIAPSHAEAWLRLAYIDSVQSSGQLSPAANAALKRAYVLAPVDAKFASWRLGFILEHWQSADPAIRAFAMDEINVLWRETPFRRSMRSLLLTLVNPSGQMALSLQVQTLERRRSSAILTP
jgi:hypothetical protein